MFKDEGVRVKTRVREDIPIEWETSSGIKGRGVIRNLSSSGAMFESPATNSLKKSVEYSLSALDPQDQRLVPSRAKMMWCRPVHGQRAYVFCGVAFLNPEENKTSAIEGHVDNRLKEMSSGMSVGVAKNYF